MKLALRRDQAAKRGLLGGDKGIEFSLAFRVSLTPREAQLVQKYQMSHETVTVMSEVAEAEAQKRLKSIGGGYQGVIKVSDLLSGGSYITKDVATLLSVEESLKRACDGLRVMLAVMSSFGGEEVIEFPLPGEQPSKPEFRTSADEAGLPSERTSNEVPASESGSMPGPLVAGWTPTHEVPAGGMAAWSKPSPSLQPVTRLAERVQLRVDETRGAWARVSGVNGWTGWVDGRLLLALTDSPPPAPSGTAEG